MFSNFVAGVSLSNGMAQIAILQVKKHTVWLRFMQEYPVADGADAAQFLQPLLDKEERIYRKVSKVSVAFDHHHAFSYSLPVDTTLDTPRRNEHLDWELQQFLPDYSPKVFVKDTHILRTVAEQRYTEVMVVAARRSLIYSIQESLKASKFELHLADANHFGALNSFIVNYPELHSTPVLLLNVSKERVDAGTVLNGKFISYRSRVWTSADDIFEFLAEEAHAVASQNVLLYGSTANHALVTNIRQRLHLTIALLNPMKIVSVHRKFRAITEFAGREHHFAAAIGCALRKE